MAAYDFQLMLKHLLEHGVAWAPNQEIVYRDQVRYTYLEMYFGIPGSGAVLHTINPNLAPENVIYTMEHAEDEVLIFHEDFLPLVEQVRSRLPSIRKYVLITDQADNEHPKEKSDIEWVDAEYEELLAGASPLAELRDCFVNTSPPPKRGNSFHRYERVTRELNAALGQIDVPFAQRLMASHDGPLASICRHAVAGKDSATNSTSIFLPAQRTMLFCHGLPCQGQYDEFVL